MTRYIASRLLAAIPVIVGVSVLVFASLYLLPGDPVLALTGDVPIEKAQADALRHELGLDQPPWVQYGRFMWNALHGDLGRSIQTQRPVLGEIITFLPATVELTVASMAFAVLFGMTLGTIAAVKPHSWIDSLTMVVALSGVSIPSFWLGLLMLLVFSLGLHWFPATGSEGLSRLVMPAFTLGYGASAIIARLTRSAMIEVLEQEYISTARSKGLSEWRVVVGHGFKNALIPVITIVGLQVGYLLSGAVIVETIFARQGIGRMLIEGIVGKDFPLVQGTILFVATLYVLVNLFVDVLYAWVDPRIRYQ